MSASDDLLGRWLARLTATTHQDLPESARAAARRFVLDSIGVGVAGSRGPYVDELLQMLERHGDGPAGVWGTSACLGAPGAAMMNAYQIHNAEYDCVHEAAVVHPMAVLLGALCAGIQTLRSEGVAVSGAQFETAVVVGVEVATSLGVASHAGLRFFRPATAGAFGACTALAHVSGFDAARLRNAFGITLGQLSGTMQAHTEGSPLLAMQVGFNARNALVAWDMARAGIPGPQNVLEGDFGFYALFEGEFDAKELLREPALPWRIEQVAHKPFPSGRATHGIVEACLSLRAAHALQPEAIAAVEVQVPPLTGRLVGRPVNERMAVNYARLCAPFVAAIALVNGDVGPADFDDQALTRADILALARRVHVVIDDNPDPNALTPVQVCITDRAGQRHQQILHTIYGHPDKPMPREAWLAKLERNLGRAREPLPDAEALAARLVSAVDALDQVDDMAALLDTLQPLAGVAA